MSVSLKMEAEHTFEISELLTTAECGKPKYIAV
jgi:hypothetical protein